MKKLRLHSCEFCLNSICTAQKPPFGTKCNYPNCDWSPREKTPIVVLIVGIVIWTFLVTYVAYGVGASMAQLNKKCVLMDCLQFRLEGEESCKKYEKFELTKKKGDKK